jgi:diguanylate cyclase (GGDEF)-like protein
MTSLNKLTTRYAFVLVLCLSLAIFAGYRVLQETQREKVVLLANTAAMQITDVIKQNRNVLYRISRRADVVRSVRLGKFTALDEKADSLGSLLPYAQRVRFLPDSVTPDPTSTPPLTQACVAFIHRTQDQQRPRRSEFHLLGKRYEHFDLVEPIKNAQGQVRGYVHASISSAPIRGILRHLESKAHYLELRQAAGRGRGSSPQVVMRLGNAHRAMGSAARSGSAVDTAWASVTTVLGAIGALSSHESVTIPIADTAWTLVFWPRVDAAPLFTGKRLMLLLVIIVAALALLAASLKLSWKVVAFVNHDIKSLARIFRDIREGSIRANYPMELSEFGKIFKYLRDSGKEMVIEKSIFKDMGLVDHLSQLNNRRHFEKKLKELFGTIKTSGYSSVLIIDLDHFKSVNDRFGHDAGDALIVKFANALKKHVRQTDFLARLGGDEFCVIYTYTDLQRAAQLAERLRQELPRDLTLTGEAVHRLRWTGGLSVMCDDDEKSDDVLWRADQALIQAKKAGRNTTRVVGPASVPVQKKNSQSR